MIVSESFTAAQRDAYRRDAQDAFRDANNAITAARTRLMQAEGKQPYSLTAIGLLCLYDRLQAELRAADSAQAQG